MEILLDNPEIEKIFKQIVLSIPPMQNGITAESLEKRGMKYEINFGVSIVDLKNFAVQFQKNHLLALKLWNKKWRETMILATMLDEPEKVSEEQMDFWVKTSENIEIIEQAVANMFVHTPYAFVKALEWCRAKKPLVKHAGLLMMGRLALTDTKSIDEMYEPFFEVITPLAKDAQLTNILYRSVCQVARRSIQLHRQSVVFATQLSIDENVTAQHTGKELIADLTDADFLSLVRK